jgi:signal transduction histidine kinase
MSLEIATMSLMEDRLAPEMLLETREKISGLVDGINRIIHNLRPPVLDDLGLESAIKWLFEKHLDAAGISYRMCMDGIANASLDERGELMLFRIVQEAVSNIVRHSQAGSVCFSSELKDGSLIIDIMDTGIGFNTEEGIDHHLDEDSMAGYGLLGMQERVSYLNGLVSVESFPHEGTHIQIRIPAQAREEAYVQDPYVDS